MATTSSLSTDLELIAEALKGRENGFEELVKRYQRPVVGYVYRMLNDYDASLDVTQEVFIKVYRSLDRYSSDFKFTTWLYRIAHNAAIDHIRRNSKKTQPLEYEGKDGVFEVEIVSDNPTPEEDREASEWRRQIEMVVKCLPSAYRELIVLRHGKDMSYGEIAEITDLPLGTVKNRLFRAREMMREMFEERGLERS